MSAAAAAAAGATTSGTTGHRSHRFRALIAILTLALAAALWLPTSVADAGGPPHRPKPTVVLVHGAWADSSSWSAVVARLQSDGYTVECAEPAPWARRRCRLPGGVPADDRRADRPGRALLRGAVITNAASGNSNVKALVYINAFIPDQGETVVQLASAQPGSALAVADPTTVFRLVPFPGSTPGDFDAYILPDVFVDAFANDLPRHTAAVLATTQRPVTLSALATPSGPPAWRAIRTWALVGTKDRVLPAAEQTAMAERARAHTVRVSASHLSMISRPKEVADLIRDAARAAR